MKRLRENPNSVEQRERMDRPEETFSRGCHCSRKNVGDPEVGVSPCIHSWPFCQPPRSKEWEIVFGSPHTPVLLPAFSMDLDNDHLLTAQARNLEI